MISTSTTGGTVDDVNAKKHSSVDEIIEALEAEVAEDLHQAEEEVEVEDLTRGEPIAIDEPVTMSMDMVQDPASGLSYGEEPSSAVFKSDGSGGETEEDDATGFGSFFMKTNSNLHPGQGQEQDQSRAQ